MIEIVIGWLVASFAMCGIIIYRIKTEEGTVPSQYSVRYWEMLTFFSIMWPLTLVLMAIPKRKSGERQWKK